MPEHFPDDLRNKVICAEARQVARRIPDDSVRLVFTDPPWFETGIYRWLAREALRVLQPGGYLFVYTSTFYLDVAFADLRRRGLDWFAMFGVLRGPVLMWSRHIVDPVQHVLSFSKGDPRFGSWFITTTHHGRADKRYHRWGQGAGLAYQVVKCLTEPGEVVWDPFCGGGTVPAVCEVLGRTYIATDQDPAAVLTTRDRLAWRDLPLFALD